jgi:hypothetical protein
VPSLGGRDEVPGSSAEQPEVALTADSTGLRAPYARPLSGRRKSPASGGNSRRSRCSINYLSCQGAHPFHDFSDQTISHGKFPKRASEMVRDCIEISLLDA